METVVKIVKPAEEIKLYHISVEQEITSSHWKAVRKQRLHCFDTTQESLYHIKPQPLAGSGSMEHSFYIIGEAT